MGRTCETFPWKYCEGRRYKSPLLCGLHITPPHFSCHITTENKQARMQRTINKSRSNAHLTVSGTPIGLFLTFDWIRYNSRFLPRF